MTTTRRVPGKHRDPVRTVRIPDDLWQQAEEAAASSGVPVSALIREGLTLAIRKQSRKARP